MKIAYENLDSVRRPVLHDALMPTSLPREDGFATVVDTAEEDRIKKVPLLPPTQQILKMIRKKVQSLSSFLRTALMVF